MAEPAPENTMFAGEPGGYGPGHKDLIQRILQLLAGVIEPFGVNFDGDHHTVQRTADGGFFKIIMGLPPEYITPGQPEDVIFVLSLYDLYLLGFLDGNKWRFFDDARLEGTGHLDEDDKHEWEKLGFEGGYSGDVFNTVKLGFNELLLTHNTLTNYSKRVKEERDDIVNALLRIMFVIPEVARFPAWLEHLQFAFSRNNNTVKLKPKPVDKSVMDAELEAKYPKKQILPDYDLGDGDEDVAALAAAKDDGIVEEELEDEDFAAAAKDEDTIEELEDEMPRIILVK
ncbi:hypothetical protein C2845_PM12G03870 [Panicum miliaceum]|uniref:rRNA N-glycosylase n=1 Tax=Panicum miliaceum TaxID=4540 RepID=A0A3L6QE15_PANMI|nr:hypothetical protein C2845_PM12G03870 [Panicum miliaceum]